MGIQISFRQRVDDCFISLQITLYTEVLITQVSNLPLVLGTHATQHACKAYKCLRKKSQLLLHFDSTTAKATGNNPLCPSTETAASNMPPYEPFRWHPSNSKNGLQPSKNPLVIVCRQMKILLKTGSCLPILSCVSISTMLPGFFDFNKSAYFGSLAYESLCFPSTSSLTNHLAL
ncbi:hypothetical protein CFOL_v3_36024 [Cephalotus follicularis]|uniref:Uncharacterized protein n=1 Tax=Cephalotus follicularis TaxID=3775 RepID=A0A1Q3DJC9_CEPFO|nr:hypothetical protein CFOL_v3_36024 [Cephalotus follicularis]